MPQVLYKYHYLAYTRPICANLKNWAHRSNLKKHTPSPADAGLSGPLQILLCSGWPSMLREASLFIEDGHLAKNYYRRKKMPSTKKYNVFGQRCHSDLRKRNSGNFRIFFAPPPKKISKIFLLLFYIFQDILRLSKNKFRVESLKTRRKFFRPPLKRVENFLAPP